MTTKAAKRKVFFSVLREHRTAVPFAKRFCEQMAPMSDELTEMGMDDHVLEMEEEAEASPEAAVKAALKSAIMAIFDNDDDVDTTMSKIETLLRAGAEVNGETTEAEEGEEGEELKEEEEGAMNFESVQRIVDNAMKSTLAEVRTLIESVKSASDGGQEAKATALIESMGREATPDRVKALLDIPSEHHGTLIESWEQKPNESKRPGKSPPATKTGDGTGATSYLESRKGVRALQKQ